MLQSFGLPRRQAGGVLWIGRFKLPRHDRVKHRAPFEIARQCRRESFRALKHRLASRGPGGQCFPLPYLLAPPMPKITKAVVLPAISGLPLSRPALPRRNKLITIALRSLKTVRTQPSLLACCFGTCFCANALAPARSLGDHRAKPRVGFRHQCAAASGVRDEARDQHFGIRPEDGESRVEPCLLEDAPATPHREGCLKTTRAVEQTIHPLSNLPNRAALAPQLVERNAMRASAAESPTFCDRPILRRPD